MNCQRILIVDDERSMSAAVAAILSIEHYPFDIANDADSALHLVEQEPYGLAILDLMMPGMNGVELFRRIHESQPDIQAIMLTAHTTIDKVFPAIDSGITRVLAKPVDANELLPLVEQLIGAVESA